MNLKYNGLLFVLIVLFEAINAGLSTNDTSVPIKATEGLEVHPAAGETLYEDEDAEAGKAGPTKAFPPKAFPPKALPSTPTPAVSSSTPSPTPAPTPERLTWIIRNSTTNTTCIIAEVAMQINITYPGQTKDVDTAVMNIPKEAVASGNCQNPREYLQINWGQGHSLVINFTANKTAKNFFVSGLSLTVNATVLKDAKVVANESLWNFLNKSSEFSTPLGMSYKCNKAQDFDLDGADPTRKAVLSLRETQIQAFMNETKPQFGAALDCDILDTPDIVPIAVGCALAILVLVVLVAYLIGRKRSQNRGYLSM